MHQKFLAGSSLEWVATYVLLSPDAAVEVPDNGRWLRSLF
jgi:hypothetical protein